MTATESFTYTVADKLGTPSTTRVTVTVTGANDAPQAKADSVSVDENQSVIINVLANDGDVDLGDVLAITGTGTTARGGSVRIENGNLVYDANADAFDLLLSGNSVTDTFTYTVSDKAGATSTATVSVTVRGVADGKPVIGGSGSDANLQGTMADERLESGNGDDAVYGLAGADVLKGGNGNDKLYGGAGIDTLLGENGSDWLDGGAGDDILTGGNGADVFAFSSGSGHDQVTDFKSQQDFLSISRNWLGGLDALRAHAVESNGNVVISTGDMSITLVGVSLSQLNATNVQFTF
jgi:VCBS repeat-containing protein